MSMIMDRYRIRLDSSRDSLTLSPYSVCRVLDGGLVGFDYPKTETKVGKLAFSDGVSVLRCGFSHREIELTFEVTDKLSFKDVRDKVIRLMSSEEDVKITTYLYGRRRFITATPAYPPEFDVNNFHVYPKVRLKLICADPFFTEGSERHLRLPSAKGMFTFPLNLMDGAGGVMSFADGGFRHRVNNPGDVKCGFRVTVRAAYGSVTQPMIMLNGQRLQLLETMSIGDELVFDTRTGEKKITLNGAVKYSFSKSDRFFSLEPGENLLTVQSVGDSANLVSEVVFTPLYLGA